MSFQILEVTTARCVILYNDHVRLVYEARYTRGGGVSAKLETRGDMGKQSKEHEIWIPDRDFTKLRHVARDHMKRELKKLKTPPKSRQADLFD